LTALRSVFGGRLYRHERAWRLVFWGKRGNYILAKLNLKHGEKIAKSNFVREARGKPWSQVEGEWSSIVRKIRAGVLQYRENAKAEYVQVHGHPHPKDQLSV